ncbi:hypothetical protein NOVOSPHI9U_290033 [Novosphingobium sp. 9U]|nr:hypothetical protein NOVOSPHI9U_290033 [Novosphingobium sp. 9U]
MPHLSLRSAARAPGDRAACCRGRAPHRYLCGRAHRHGPERPPAAGCPRAARGSCARRSAVLDGRAAFEPFTLVRCRQGHRLHAQGPAFTAFLEDGRICLAALDKEIAGEALDDASGARLSMITGVNLTVATGLVAAIADIRRFSSPPKAGELLRSQPAGSLVGSRYRPPRTHPQVRSQPRPRDTGRSGLGGGKPVRVATKRCAMDCAPASLACGSCCPL